MRNVVSLFVLVAVLSLGQAAAGSAAVAARAEGHGPIAAAGAPSFSRPASFPGCPYDWTIIDGPQIAGSHTNWLMGVTVAGPGDIWAVGGSDVGTVTAHYTGTVWTQVPAPLIGAQAPSLNGVDALAPGSLWAVGMVPTPGGIIVQTVVEHFDGAQWNVVDSPNVGSGSNTLYSVAVISPTNIWAVGYYEVTSPFGVKNTLIEHYDGSTWSVVASPNVDSQSNVLMDVVAVASNDIWAVGTYGMTQHTLVEHFNGQEWSVVASPNAPGQSESYLSKVVALSAMDLWAVGGARTASSISLIEHYDGVEWTIEASPNPGGDQNDLGGVVASSQSEIFAGGGTFAGSIIERRNGMTWTGQAIPGGYIQDMDIDAERIYAVGQEQVGGDYPILILAGAPGECHYSFLPYVGWRQAALR